MKFRLLAFLLFFTAFFLQAAAQVSLPKVFGDSMVLQRGIKIPVWGNSAPGALVISKIVYPETEESETKGKVKLEIKKAHANLMDAISHGAGDGMRISLNVIAMLLGFIALIAMVDAGLGWLGNWLY